MSIIETPVFWDLHLHGVAGIDFMRAGEEECVKACLALGSHGTGAFAPTLLTSESQLLFEAAKRWGRFIEKLKRPGYLPKLAAIPVGLHLEGPVLNPSMAGAHPKAMLRKPKNAQISDLISAAQGHVAIVTLAPELPGALRLIRKLRSQGIRVQMGHTAATSKQALDAAKAGAMGITHLYNAMRTHHRDPGVITPLSRGLVTAEIITDGKHLSPDFVHWCWRAAKKSIYAVSDGCSAVGSRRGQTLTLGSLNLRRDKDIAVVKGANTLAGGATFLCDHPERMNQAFTASERSALLALFYSHQRAWFQRQARTVARRRNTFDSNTLRFLETF